MVPENSIESPRAADLERWGLGLLWGGLVGGLGGVLALAWLAPEFVPFVPLAVVGAVVFVVLFQYPTVNLAVVLAGYAVLITTSPGIQLSEAVYGIYYLPYLTHWYGVRLLRREPLVPSHVCGAAALLIVFGLCGGAVLGLAMGARPGNWVGEVLGFLMVLFYFPLKEACKRDQYGPDIVFLGMLWFGVFVALRNALAFREALGSAAGLIEISGARAALNEVHLLVGVLGTLIFLVMVSRWRTRFLLLGPFFFYLAALLMTKARGFWVDALFGIAVLFFLLSTRERARLVIFSFGGLLLFAAAVTLAFNEVGRLLVYGVLDRFSTLETAAVADVSLVNRFNETASVWEWIRLNPILGYGLGASFTFYDWIFNGTLTTSFIHNGFVALWFKLGLWGLLITVWLWVAAVWHGLKAYRSQAPLRYRAYALTSAVSLIAIIPSTNTSSPFFIDDSLMSFVMLTAICAGLYERLVPSRPASASEAAPR